MSLHDLYEGCRTYRKFTQEPVGKGLLEQCIENARISSSASNAQPIRFVAVSTPEMVGQM